MRPDTGEARADRPGSARSVGTRAAILDYLRSAREPVGVARICDAFGLNHTGVRRHLANLRDAGLVTQHVAAPSGRGRPTLEFEATPAADEPALEDSQRDLIRLLLEMVTTGEDARVVGRRAGERLVAGVDPSQAAHPSSPGDALRAVQEAARRMGFEPSLQVGSDGAEEVLLRHCPFSDGATLAPQVVCELHLGMTEGMARAMGSAAQLSFVFADPHAAGCRLVAR
ncbi:MAG: helix-turn-helix domain-containing protein [Dermatophilaceae bacterium]